MATGGLYSPIANHADDSGSEQLQNTNVSYSKNFDPKRQSWSLFRAQGARMTLTGLLVALVMLVLKLFENYGNVGNAGKRLFNFIITALSLILGFNFFEAFKDMAKVLRWRVLADRDFSIRHADLILGGESLQKIVALWWESPKKSLTVFFCTMWITLNILAQASVATIGLTYSLDSGTNSSGITTKAGNVTVPTLDCYYHNDECATGPQTPMDVAQDLAHRFGENIRARHRCSYRSDSDIQSAPQDCYYFHNKNGQEFALRYAEYNPDDSTRAYPFLTDRVVKASAGECFHYNIDVEGSRKADSSDGKQDVFVWNYYNSTFNGTISVPTCDTANDSTTYIYNGALPPQNATAQSCGARCMWLYALQNTGPLTKSPMMLVQCSINISEASNMIPDHDWQILPDMNARLAAASIALTGRYTYPNGSVTKHWQQYRLYPWGSYWETQNKSAAKVGAKMSEFAIGSLAVMADLNPQTSGQGTVPILGYRVSVGWGILISLLAGVVVVHFILVVLMLWFAKPVAVPDDSNLCTARLLEGLVGRLGGKGSFLDGKEMAEALSRQGAGRVVYGIRDMEEKLQGRVLEVGENVTVRRKGKRFPGGLYT